MYFPESFLSIMIYVSLAGITAAGITLIILVIRDIKRKKLW
jgi:hypothetical protein